MQAVQDIIDWAESDEIDQYAGIKTSRFDVVKFKQQIKLECVKAIDSMIENKKNDFSVLSFTQHNHYADWNLQDIRAEKAKLLGKLEHAIIKEESKYDD